MTIRVATKADQPRIVRLIADVFREYGETICLDNCDSDLLDLDRHYFSQGGIFWALEIDETLLGTSAVVPSCEPRTSPLPICFLKRLYLHPSLRGGNWGKALMQQAVDWARKSGFLRMEFWSDTRFSRAHHFYLKFGCQMSGQTRTMLDGYTPYEEYHFQLDLKPIKRIEESQVT